jgi:uncharacterized protein YukE
MKGIFDMATPSPGSIYGQIDGIANNAQGLQSVSDSQAQLMQQLSQTCENLVPHLQGAAGTAMQQVGQQLHAQGMQFATAFADHSQMMKNNATLLTTHDQDHAHIISQVGNLS